MQPKLSLFYHQYFYYNPRKINVKSSLVHDDDKNSKAKA